MATRHSNLTSLFTDIASAIKSKTGSSAKLKADDFDTAILAIPTPTGNKEITATTSTQTNIDVKSYATVSVNPTPTEEKTVTDNGVVTPSSGKYLSKVTVSIPEYDGSYS